MHALLWLHGECVIRNGFEYIENSALIFMFMRNNELFVCSVAIINYLCIYTLARACVECRNKQHTVPSPQQTPEFELRPALTAQSTNRCVARQAPIMAASPPPPSSTVSKAADARGAGGGESQRSFAPMTATRDTAQGGSSLRSTSTTSSARPSVCSPSSRSMDALPSEWQAVPAL